MITQETIDRIAELVAAQNIERATAPDAVVAPSTMGVHDLEKYLPHRRRMRARFETRAIAAFADYLSEHQNFAPIFVDDANATAKCVIDLGDAVDPGHCDHTATLTLKHTALWAAICAADGAAMSQRTLADWIEDWRHALRAFDAPDGNEIPLGRAVTAIRTINIKAAVDVGHTVGDMKETRSAFQSVEASSPEGLPAVFVATVKPYEELPEREVTLRVSVMTGDSPSLKLRIVARGVLEEAIGLDFVNKLRASLSTSQSVLLGKIATS